MSGSAAVSCRAATRNAPSGARAIPVSSKVSVSTSGWTSSGGGQRHLRVVGERGCEQVPAAGSEPVIPVADRVVVLEQERADAAVLARRAALGVGGEVGSTGEHPGAERDDRDVAGHRDAVDAAVGGDEQARLPGTRRKQPERLDLPIGIRLHVGIRPARGKDQRAVGQERRAAGLARGRTGEAPRRLDPGGSTCQIAERIFLPSGSGPATATTRRRPSGDRRRPDRRGSSRKRSKSKSVMVLSVPQSLLAAVGYPSAADELRRPRHGR